MNTKVGHEVTLRQICSTSPPFATEITQTSTSLVLTCELPCKPLTQIELDPTTMLRIAEYNAEGTVAELLETIVELKKEKDNLQKEISCVMDKWHKIISFANKFGSDGQELPEYDYD